MVQRKRKTIVLSSDEDDDEEDYQPSASEDEVSWAWCSCLNHHTHIDAPHPPQVIISPPENGPRRRRPKNSLGHTAKPKKDKGAPSRRKRNKRAAVERKAGDVKRPRLPLSALLGGRQTKLSFKPAPKKTWKGTGNAAGGRHLLCGVVEHHCLLWLCW